MQSVMRTVVLTVLMLMLSMSVAFAEGAKTFGIVPFTVNGPKTFTYLERAIPQMLSSRLFWKDHFIPVDATALDGIAAPANTADAQKALSASGADYLVYGSVNLIGDQASLDVRVADKDGNVWPRSASSSLNDMIPTLQNIAGAINTEVFDRPDARAQAVADAKQRVNQMNPAITVNQTSANQEVYLNPQFRYAGANESNTRLRSNALRFAAHGMVVADITGDKKNEVVLLDKHNVRVYNFDKNTLVPVTEKKVSSRYDMLTVRALDIDRDGVNELIISGMDKDQAATTYFYTMKGGQLVEFAPNVKMLVNVVPLPPNYLPTMIGQKTRKGGSVLTPKVEELAYVNGEVVPSRRVAVPKKANLYNFAWVPDEEGDKVVVLLPDSEKLAVFNSKFDRMVATDVPYSGSTISIENDDTMPGLGKDKLLIPAKYYIPMPFVVEDLDHNGKYEVLVNKPISVAAQFFDRYRFFPQGEIHSLQWDGVGLGLQWKTRRIKGGVMAYQIADLNNDGIMDLVVGINTHPGATGFEARKTMVLGYPLDLGKVDPSTAADKGYSEEQ
ncbi:FG-GAP repeat domain-containing protein [Halodesulfovibrio marinisediminis]|uniref:Repeat domain-containing protein n=1 Tax=Halodesulfovibrio marinisediminis DSM 17456 TaxID=1121457 RepID=A0A1N6F1M0_9BACT|nr:VCBS repeat-containing protein [Halodesulfovibrio marinisediminis]SIN89133.1 Repeat domain-containing protein [Halodesulfovibrio marinisediminis DSM 17456]